ncbi:MAG: hypothetical protein HPZ91_05960 [Lentisphaeria bacterium]|nr:hypothetical protein [Lentisphaeria bacterium]
MMETKVKITREIKEAIIRAIEASGGQSALERKTGVKQNNLSKYISDKADSITSAVWDKLEPALRPYLPGDIINAGNVSGNGRINGPVIGKAGQVIHHAARADELITCRAEAYDKVLDAVMESDIDDAAKIKFYSIIKKLKQEG